MELDQDAIKWLANGERGISSETIFEYLTGVPTTGRFGCDRPRDPDDFRRCELLLEQVPSLRAKFHLMSFVSPVWANLVLDWDKIKSMILEEAPNWEGRASKAYTYMKSIGC